MTEKHGFLNYEKNKIPNFNKKVISKKILLMKNLFISQMKIMIGQFLVLLMDLNLLKEKLLMAVLKGN